MNKTTPSTPTTNILQFRRPPNTTFHCWCDVCGISISWPGVAGNNGWYEAPGYLFMAFNEHHRYCPGEWDNSEDGQRA